MNTPLILRNLAYKLHREEKITDEVNNYILAYADHIETRQPEEGVIGVDTPTLRWVKASERVPWHLAFFNIENGAASDCYFPVKVNGYYRLAELFDDKKKDADESIPYFYIRGEDYFEDRFDQIEWLDDPLITKIESNAAKP